MKWTDVVVVALSGVTFALAAIYRWEWFGADSTVVMGIVCVYVVAAYSHKNGRALGRSEIAPKRKISCKERERLRKAWADSQKGPAQGDVRILPEHNTPGAKLGG